MCLFTRRVLVTAFAAWAVCFAVAANSLAANWYLAPATYSDISQFNSINYFAAQAYDPNIPLNAGDTVSPVPTGFASPGQNGFVQALPGGQGGSMNEYSLSPAGFSMTIGLVSAQAPVGYLSNASLTGILTFGAFDGLPLQYSLSTSFVFQSNDPQNPDGSGEFQVMLKNVSSGQLIYSYQAQSNGVNSVYGSPWGTLPYGLYRLNFYFANSASSEGGAFGNGLLNLALEPGDINRDAHVNSGDIEAMMAALTDLPSYQTANGLTNPQQFLQVADVNRDGKFNNADLQALLNLPIMGGGSAATVPEPASIVLLGLGALAIAFRRRSR